MAQAYVNHGRWVADCGRPYCGGAEQVTAGQAVLSCSNCRLVQPVAWPEDAAAIWAALAVRPVPQTRNWAPPGHRQAVACGVPGGQSVADLIDETREHEVV
ncbi:hypothetical protein ACN27B_08755 [Micromonospora sp. WMMD754]|uniref:hypothetical protein n=1 Tax=Micromonospora sp. WMMD754 TaxID=3404114 RepID=UPI003BF4847F